MAEKFEDLAIYQMARALSQHVYEITATAPFAFDTRFVQQMHASAGSVMDNIAEGYEREGNKEFINFLYISKGSCGEVRSQLIRSLDCNYIDKETYDRMYDECVKMSVALASFIRQLKQSSYRGSKYKSLNP